MKKVVFWLLFLLPINIVSAFTLSDSAKVSLITCAPGDELYARFGHTAIRICDASQGVDLVYNYGSFNFNTENFYVKFLKGETDYQLSVYDSRFFYPEYAARFTRVWEQYLDLLPEEKQQLFDALMINYEPQNRKYRYNFIFDNCATRPRDMIEKYLNGRIHYAYTPVPKTFRELLSVDLGEFSWLKLGVDLLLGSPADRVATTNERMFLPIELMNYYATATVERNGIKKALVTETLIPIEAALREANTSWYAQPLLATSLLLLFVVIISFFYRHKALIWMDMVLFSIAGLVGVIIFFLSYFSVHPAVSSNFNLFWAHPLQLVFVALLPIKKMRKALSYYQLVNAGFLILSLAGGLLFPQKFNIAIFPFIAALFILALLFVRNQK